MTPLRTLHGFIVGVVLESIDQTWLQQKVQSQEYAPNTHKFGHMLKDTSSFRV